MAFTEGALINFPQVGAGEIYGSTNIILSATTFEDGLLSGRFAKLDTGSIDNLDGSSAPVIAGVVKRSAVSAVEDGSAYDSDITTKIDYIRSGLVTVGVKTGETPSMFDRVYVSNDGDANDGLATATNTDVDANAEFITEIESGVWLIYITPAPGDLVTPTLLADPGDAGAIPVTRSGNCAITTAGAETRTLAIPSEVGITLDLSCDVYVGDAVITVASAFNQAGNTTITLNTAGDFVRLAAVQVAGAPVWRLVVNDGAVLG